MTLLASIVTAVAVSAVDLFAKGVLVGVTVYNASRKHPRNKKK